MSALDIHLKSSDKPFAFKAATSNTPAGMLGYLEGYCSVFSNVDSHNERVMPGAFTDTIVNEGGQGLIKLFYDHYCPLGTAEEYKQDDYGLWLGGYVVDTSDNADCVKHIGTTAKHASFAYRVMGDEQAEDGVTNLTKLKVYEGGPVIWPANRRASMSMRKHLVTMGLFDGEEADPKATDGDWKESFAALASEVKAAIAGFKAEHAGLDSAEIAELKSAARLAERIAAIENKLSTFEVDAEKSRLGAALASLETAFTARTQLLKGDSLNV